MGIGGSLTSVDNFFTGPPLRWGLVLGFRGLFVVNFPNPGPATAETQSELLADHYDVGDMMVWRLNMTNVRKLEVC